MLRQYLIRLTSKGIIMSTIKELYQYREMIRSMINRELKGRYKGSLLGVLWSFLNPLLQMLVYTIVFSFIMRNGIEDYYLFLIVALVPWIFLSGSLTAGAACIRGQKEMVNKIYFPREIIPLSLVTSQLINMFYAAIVVALILLISGKGVNLNALCFLPIIIISEYLFTLGLTLIVSAVTVFFRDLEYITGIIVMAWQFLSPVMYGIDFVPEGIARKLFDCNPMTPIITAYRDILYYKTQPDSRYMLMSMAYGVCIFIIGAIVFRILQKRFSEVL